MKRFISNLSVEINITLFSIQSRHRGNVVLLRILTLMVFFVTTFLSQQAMAKKLHTPCVACSISGTTPVTQGNTATYTLAGSCSATSWTVTCGTIQSSSSSSVTIYFNVLGCTSSVITALNGTTTLATKTITVNAAPVLSGGTISNPTQTINFGTVPAQVNASVATGGTCGGAYTYQWYSSPNNSTWTVISGATGQNYQPGALTSTIYFERLTTCNTTAYTTNTALVTVYPQIIPGAISPSSYTVNYNTAPGKFQIGSPSGGSGSYTYQWYSSPNNSTWTSISGATSGAYFPPALTSTTYYLCQVISNGAAVNSASVVVNVYPQLIPGSIVPSAQFIAYNTVPSQLSLSGTTGGNGSYSYQWYSSANGGSTWSLVTGATTNTYTPGALTTTSEYEVVVTSNGAQVTTITATVSVYPQLVPGTVGPSQSISYNTAPSTLTLSGVSGGSGTYSYQWLDSTNSTSWTIINGATSTTYSPPVLTSNTYYEVKVTSNGVSAFSSYATISIIPQLSGGTITPSNITINSGTAPEPIYSTNPASGGSCSGSYTYQWYSSTNGASYTSISGATGVSYSPNSLTANTWYYRQAICNGVTANSNICVVTISAGTPDMNFVVTRSISKAGVPDSATALGLTSSYDFQQVTQFTDGIGRPVQTVAMQETPLQNDLVAFNVYDNFGREAIKNMPYAATSSNGAFKPTAQNDQYSFNTAMFPSEQYYYSATSFETSPLERPLATYAPGISWEGSGRGKSVQYLFNQTNDSVHIWSIAYPIGSIPTTTTTYPSGSLYKTVTTDEAGLQTVEYKDITGHVVLKKAQLATSPGTAHVGWLCTYYVYDDLDYLRFVIQPQAVVLIDGSWSISAGIANELCFRYEYDSHGHLIVKKIPGAGEAHMVYDIRDRLVMSQDSLLRNQQKWLYTKYDAENRPDSTGLITDPTYYNNLTYYDTTAFKSNNFPLVASYTNELLTQTFYDDYSWVSTYSAPVSATMATGVTSGNSFITSYNASPIYAVNPLPFYVVRGMMTGSKKEVLGSSGGQYLYTASFYDDRGRTIQTQETNYTGGVDTATTQFDFTGKPVRSLLGHRKNGNTVQNHTILTKMDYDQAFRIRHIWKNIDNATSDQLIDSMQYNELGQLNAKYLGNNVDSLVYNYNIRGWLTGINQNYVAGTTTHYFGMELGYDKSTSAAPGNTYTTQEFNGNIEGTVWKSAGSGLNRKYDFVYDKVNRLTGAAFLQNTSGSAWDRTQIDYSVSNLSYDANGNILSMTQNGFTVGSTGAIDQLSYTYQSNSNKLSQVTDAVNNPNSKLGDFHYTGTKGSYDYTYDGNGNMSIDNNKAIDNISYNYLNLPQLVHMNTKGNVAYTYDATGGKLKKVTTDSMSRHSITTLYIGGFVYQQTDTITNPGGNIDTLQSISHEEGRARWAYHKYTTGATGYKFEYDFFERDHLGNTRMELTQERDTSNYLASMEAAYRATESQLFANIASTSYARTSVPGYPANTSITNPNDSVSKVDYNGSTGQTSGPSLLLKVMSGDTVTIGVQSYYNTNSITTTNSSLSSVVQSLALQLLNTPGGGAEGNLAGFTSQSGTVYTGVQNFLNTNDPQIAGYPKAYLNWVFLDDQFNYISTSSGSVPAGNSSKLAGTLNTLAPGAPLTMPKNGYLYIWVSNETQGWDVYFDNLSVQYKQGPVLEENHYYPFGLAMAGISDKAIKTQQYSENKYRYNGKELQNKEFSDGSGLEEYDYGARMYEPQIGRWNVIDPLANKTFSYSPYTYTLNNPNNLIDPDGRIVIDPNASKEDREALKHILKEVSSHINGLGKNSKELKALLALSGFGSKKDMLKFLKANDQGPTLTVGVLAKGTPGGLDDGKGGAASLGRTDPSKKDAGTITLDRGLVDVAKDAIESERTGIPSGSLTPANGYSLPNGIAGASSDAFGFIGRVVEHEVVHWGAFYNLGMTGENDNVNLSFLGINLSFERGQFFESAAFGNLGNPFNPISNPSWAIVNQYTHTEYLYTGGRRNPNVPDVGKQINKELEIRASQFKLLKDK